MQPRELKLANRLRGRRLAIALLLTAGAGFVDIFAYLALYRVFVANTSPAH